MTLPMIALSAILSYLLGSIPTGYLMAKAKGVDIRSVGSGNIGATNVFRVLGKGPGIITLAVDFLKGLVAVLAVPLLTARLFSTGQNEILKVICALAVILGHNYTCWLKFKGGKGIATSAGVLLAWMPWGLILVLGLWLLALAIGRYVSLASILAASALPFAAWWTVGSPRMIGIAALVGA